MKSHPKIGATDEVQFVVKQRHVIEFALGRTAPEKTKLMS